MSWLAQKQQVSMRLFTTTGSSETIMRKVQKRRKKALENHCQSLGRYVWVVPEPGVWIILPTMTVCFDPTVFVCVFLTYRLLTQLTHQEASVVITRQCYLMVQVTPTAFSHCLYFISIAVSLTCFLLLCLDLF